MKKRIFAAVLVLILTLSVVLTACGNNERVETKDVKLNADTVITFTFENAESKEGFSSTASFADGDGKVATAKVSLPTGHYNVTVTAPDPDTGGNAPIAITTFDCPTKADNGLTAITATYTAATKAVEIKID